MIDVHSFDGFDLLLIGFTDTPATSQDLVLYVNNYLPDDLDGGKLLKINGAASLPIAFVLAHRLCHLYGAVAVYDPKLQGYVVVVTHTPDYKLGELLQ